MSTRTRIAVTLGAAGAALTLVGSALAAYTSPRLYVTDNRTGPVLIEYQQSANDDPSAKIQIFAPTGYSATLGQAAGTTVGTVSAVGTAGDLGGAVLPLTGTVAVRSATGTYSSGGSQVPLAAAAQQCTGTPNHTAFWVLVLQAAGQTLELPAFVDSTAGTPSGVFSTATIQFCLPPPDVPAGTPGRATFGFKLTRAALTLRGVFASVGSGQLRWRAVATPYNPGAGTVNAAGTVEIQSLVGWPRAATLRRPALVSARRGVATYRISGRLQLPSGHRGVVRLIRGRTARALATATAVRVSGTAVSGTLRLRQTNRQQTFFAALRATVARADLGTAECQATFSPVPCISATRAGYTVRSSAVRFTVPRRR